MAGSQFLVEVSSPHLPQLEQNRETEDIELINQFSFSLQPLPTEFLMTLNGVGINFLDGNNIQKRNYREIE